jgi:hypothetical protein
MLHDMLISLLLVPPGMHGIKIFLHSLHGGFALVCLLFNNKKRSPLIPRKINGLLYIDQPFAKGAAFILPILGQDHIFNMNGFIPSGVPGE